MASLFKWQAYVATLLIQKNLASNLARFFCFPKARSSPIWAISLLT